MVLLLEVHQLELRRTGPVVSAAGPLPGCLRMGDPLVFVVSALTAAGEARGQGLETLLSENRCGNAGLAISVLCTSLCLSS